MLTEIFAHDVFATIYDDPECEGNVFIVGGKDFDSQPFELYLTLEEAQSLLVQLGYQVYERNYENGQQD